MEINFRDMFLSQEEDDEESANLADALAALDGEYPNGEQFQASDLARVLNDPSELRIDVARERAATLREFLFQELPAHQTLTAKAVGKRLKRHQGEPVKGGGRTMCLKSAQDPHSKTTNFWVDAKP